MSKVKVLNEFKALIEFDFGSASLAFEATVLKMEQGIDIITSYLFIYIYIHVKEIIQCLIQK